jgi:monoamine oxidase
VKRRDCDVAIIGAGVAGLTAAAILKGAGKEVRCLEATDRVGGRILTLHDPLAPLPIELGAEFVHGRPPETWEWIRSANLTAYEHSAEALHLDSGRVLQDRHVGEIADRFLSQSAKFVARKDRSFEDYLRRSRQRADLKDWARVHIEGFNAARAELISVASLTQDAEAAEQIEGDRAFRILWSV